MHYAIIIIIILIIVISTWQFVSYSPNRQHIPLYRTGISFELFYTLLICYGIVISGFGLLYFMLSFDESLLVEIGQVPTYSVRDALYRSFYFSGVTMLTIGYGDIIPIGIGRLLAVIQALIGYILPATFVWKVVQVSRVDHKYVHLSQKEDL